MVYYNFLDYGNKLQAALKTVKELEVNNLKTELSKRMDGESEIFIIGNGGSAANAYHISGDYLKTFSMLKKCIKINSLSVILKFKLN